MKKLNYILLLLVIATTLSCDTDEFLNPDPDYAVGQDGYFSSDAEVLSGIIGIYDAIQGDSEEVSTNWVSFNRGIQYEFLLTEHRSDNTRSQSENERQDYHTYRVMAGDIYSEDYYASMYEIIFRANNILQFMDVADAGNVAAYTGEAKFLRAYAYFNLVRLYGPVPLVTTPLLPGDEAAYVRADVSAVYAQIEEDLLAAIAGLPAGAKTRASQDAARALLAKSYMSQPNREYLLAQGLLEDVMNSTRYRLLDDFSDVFYDERNEEVIFAIGFEGDLTGQCQIFSSEFDTLAGREDGLNMAENNLLAAFEENGGNRTEVSLLLQDADSYFPNKFRWTSSNARCAGNDWIVLRYADVLLMHAEAVLAGGQSTSSANAVSSINAVRMRANLEDVDEVNIDNLLLERKVEFAFENQRFFDLQRFGLSNTVLSAYAAEAGYEFSPNQLLLPIPPREIQQSGFTMQQNPGY